jgi:MFS family permease
VWVLSLVYFGCVMGIYGVSFWLPQIISETITRDPWQIGLVSMIPWGVAAVTAVLVGASSDRHQERRWHIAAGAIAGGAAFALSGLPSLAGWAGLACLTVAIAGVLSATTTFWSLPTAILSGSAAAAGIAWINSVGNLSGYVSPFVLGAIRDATRDAAHPNGNMFLALSVLAVSLFLAGVLTLVVTRKPRNVEADPERVRLRAPRQADLSRGPPLREIELERPVGRRRHRRNLHHGPHRQRPVDVRKERRPALQVLAAHLGAHRRFVHVQQHEVRAAAKAGVGHPGPPGRPASSG